MGQLGKAGAVERGEQEYAALVGIDWADREHAWVMEVAGGKRESGLLAQTPEAIQSWAAELAGRFEGREVAVAVEQARGALVYALSQYAHLVLYPVHPSTSSRYRAAVHPSGAKDDPKDAEVLLELLAHHRNRLRRLEQDTVETRKLRILVQKRRQLVDEKTAAGQNVRDQLKQYYPQVLEWFDDIDSPVVGAFLECWPRLADVQKAGSEQILTFLRQHNCRSASRNAERVEQIRQARALTVDAAIVEPAVLVVQTLLEVIQALRAGIARIEQAIEEVFAAHPDAAIFDSFPGAGPVMAPRLLAAFGSRRDRFSSAAEMQTYSGIAPVISRSGNSSWTHFRWACPKFLRQTFHEYAGCSLAFCGWARAHYDRQRSKGKGHHAALRSLAFKWIRILYRCWTDSVPYAESRHVPGLAASTAESSPPPERRCSTAKDQSPAVEFGWKQVGGFWKFSVANS